MNKKDKYHDLVEQLAGLEHDQWMRWSKALADKERLSAKCLHRWEACWVPYNQLPEAEKDKDREWARKALFIMRNYHTDA